MNRGADSEQCAPHTCLKTLIHTKVKNQAEEKTKKKYVDCLIKVINAVISLIHITVHVYGLDSLWLLVQLLKSFLVWEHPHYTHYKDQYMYLDVPSMQILISNVFTVYYCIKSEMGASSERIFEKAARTESGLTCPRCTLSVIHRYMRGVRRRLWRKQEFRKKVLKEVQQQPTMEGRRSQLLAELC